MTATGMCTTGEDIWIEALVTARPFHRLHLVSHCLESTLVVMVTYFKTPWCWTMGLPCHRMCTTIDLAIALPVHSNHFSFILEHNSSNTPLTVDFQTRHKHSQ